MPTFSLRTFYSITPEWPCELGGTTRCLNNEEIMNHRAYIRNLDNIQVFFNTIPEDDFIQCTSCYLVTERLAQALRDEKITGVRFETPEVFKSDMFKGYCPRQRVPSNYLLMLPLGEMRFSNYHFPTSWSGDDVCLAFYPEVDLTSPGPINVQHWLIVSEKFYNLLKRFKFENWQKQERILYTESEK